MILTFPRTHARTHTRGYERTLQIRPVYAGNSSPRCSNVCTVNTPCSCFSELSKSVSVSCALPPNQNKPEKPGPDACTECLCISNNGFGTQSTPSKGGDSNLNAFFSCSRLQSPLQRGCAEEEATTNHCRDLKQEETQSNAVGDVFVFSCSALIPYLGQNVAMD